MLWGKASGQAWLSWLFVGLLAGLSACLAILQYRWIGEVSRAEGERLHESLRENLTRFSRDFNSELSAACSSLLPDRIDQDETVREREYASRFASHSRIIRNIWLVEPEGDSATLKKLREQAFESVNWPAAWEPIRDRMEARLSGERFPMRMGFRDRRGGGPDTIPDLVEIPRFSRPEPDGPRPREVEWLLVQLDLDYIRNTMLPDLLQRDLGDYQARVAMAENASKIVYTSDAKAAAIDGDADATVRFFELRPDLMFRFGPGPGGGGPGGPGGPGPGRRRGGMQPPAGQDRGRWTLLVRHKAGSLEAVVAQARWRNLAVTTGLFILLIAAIAALVRYTRRAQRLAELQMEFVAGVSHELRTPLSVMRTAGHNLRGKMAGDPVRVQRYGELIEEESEKLTAIVEQVLRFANVKAGRVIGVMEPVSVESLITAAVQADRKLLDESGCRLERNIAPELPPVQGDPTSLKHALRNLLSNAAKYGRSGDWIGVSAALDEPGGQVEIRIADHGPGIPRDEVNRIFDPFYRGKTAVQDQIHGTGLGLSLAKRIIEAHAGTIAVRTEPGQGTEFIVHIPIAVQETAA